MGLNLKKQQIKKAAFSLFNKYGIKKVSVKEICKSSSTSKPTFYKFFPNKKHLAKHGFCFLLLSTEIACSANPVFVNR